MTDSNGDKIREYAKCWHDVQENILPTIDKFDAIEATKQVGFPCTQEEASTELKYVPTDDCYRLAWVVDTAKFKVWVDAITSDILHFDTYLGAYDGYVFAYDSDPNGGATYVAAKSVYNRLDTAVDFPSTGQAYYKENQTLSSYIGALEDSDVYFIIGHGGLGWDGNDYVSYICATDDNMYPSDVATKTISSMELAFLCSCSSFSDDEDVDQTIAQEFLDGGADCVFGWTGNVLKGPAQTYCKDFFDMAVNDPVKKDAGPLYIRIVSFSKQAESCGQFLKKGSPVFVEGRLQIAKWETEAGQNASRPEVIANFIQFLSSGKKTESDQAWDNALGEAIKKVDDLTDDDCDELPF